MMFWPISTANGIMITWWSLNGLLQAASDIPDNVENVCKLLSHPAIDIRTPNKVYSLIGGFCEFP
ncbi:unnamed protein product [Rhodiola kirilowii]